MTQSDSSLHKPPYKNLKQSRLKNMRADSFSPTKLTSSMDNSVSVPIHPTTSEIPFDLFVSKKHPGLPRGDLGFLDSSGILVYKVTHQSLKSKTNRILLDSADNPLLTLCLTNRGCWEGYKGGQVEESELMFRVKRTKNKFTRVELEVFVVSGEVSREEPVTCDFKVRGFPFQKSCSIYSGDVIVAQSSLMYKLHQPFPKRGKFRLTIFPGSLDHALIAAFFVIFLD